MFGIASSRGGWYKQYKKKYNDRNLLCIPYWSFYTVYFDYTMLNGLVNSNRFLPFSKSFDYCMYLCKGRFTNLCKNSNMIK